MHNFSKFIAFHIEVLYIGTKFYSNLNTLCVPGPLRSSYLIYLWYSPSKIYGVIDESQLRLNQVIQEAAMTNQQRHLPQGQGGHKLLPVPTKVEFLISSWKYVH